MLAYKNTQFLNNILIIGCGGTGSRLLPLVAQKLSKGRYNGILPMITLVDGDEVEIKNLTRQHFIATDVGRNKAEVLAERYGDAFELPIISCGNFYVSRGNLNESMDNMIPPQAHDLFFNRHKTIFLCVDNMEIRYEILKDLIQSNLFSQYPDLIIDAGNENTFGQVRVYHAKVIGDTDHSMEFFQDLYLKDPLNPVLLPYIPCPINQYYQTKNLKGTADRSCAELEQTGAVNNQMAATMFSIFQSMYDHQEVKVETWFHDIHNGNSQTMLDLKWVKEISTDDRYQMGDLSGVLKREIKEQDTFWTSVEDNFIKGLEGGAIEKMAPELKLALGL